MLTLPRTDFLTILPEILLTVSILVLLVAGVSLKKNAASVVYKITIFVLLGIGVLLCMNSGTSIAFNSTFIDDSFARFAKILIIVCATVILLLCYPYFSKRVITLFEFPVLVLFATLGMMIMVSANSFMVLYVGLELQSLTFYILTSIRRDNIKSTEAGLKYFILGSLSSGILLYGISLLYGYAGTTQFTDIAQIITTNDLSLGVLFGLVFLLAGLAFKISAVPFHMWTPDVYEGAPTPITAFLVTAPKVAGLVLIVRILFTSFESVITQWQQIIVFLSVASMFVGSIAAINQTNLKRLMAYSSIGHVGFALVGLAAGSVLGAQSILLYMVIYVVTNLGVFSFIISMEKEGQKFKNISDLAGLSRTNAPLALALSVLMFSLAGIPPMIGFFGKYFSFMAAIEAGLMPLAVAGVIASVIATFYYLRIVKIMFVDEQKIERDFDLSIATSQKLVLGICAMLTVLSWLPIFNGFNIVEISGRAVETLFL